MAVILFVRIKSDLDYPELEKRMMERVPRFKEVLGLVQKFYGRDESAGNYCGVYIFKDSASLAAFRDSELAKTIPWLMRQQRCAERYTRCSSRFILSAVPSRASFQLT